MDTNKKHNRRFFIKSVLVGLSVGTIALWDRMLVAQKKINSNRRVTLPFDNNKEINFQDNFIVINKDNNTKVFSSRCTHLGCKIDKIKDGSIICPCHGSKFDLSGMPTQGPAIKSLEEKKFELNKDNTITIIV